MEKAYVDLTGYGTLSVLTRRAAMREEPPPPSIERELTAEIVAAYVRQNQIASDQLATLISTVHRALVGLGKPATEAEVERTPRCRSGDPFTGTTWFASNVGGAARCLSGMSPPATD